MVRARQDSVAGDRLVARFSLRRFMPHVVLGLASVALPAAALGAVYGMWLVALGGVALASLILAVGVALLTRIEIVMDHEALRWPAAALVVPWADVASLSLVGSPAGSGTLHVEVRNGSALAQRQLPGPWIWHATRRRLADTGVLDVPLGWLDHSPGEILETAAAHCPGSHGSAPEVERRIVRNRRLVMALAIAVALLQAITIAGWVLL